MRQSAWRIYAPHENEFFVGVWRAWRIRRRTITKPAKTDIVNRVFLRLGFVFVCRGTESTPLPFSMPVCQRQILQGSEA